jgi:hypothetical protein
MTTKREVYDSYMQRRYADYKAAVLLGRVPGVGWSGCLYDVD